MGDMEEIRGKMRCGVHRRSKINIYIEDLEELGAIEEVEDLEELEDMGK